MAETIDDIAKTAPQQGKKEEPKLSTSKSVVNELSDLIKTGANLGLAVGIPWTLGKLVPSMKRDAALVSTGFSAGKLVENYRIGKKTTAGDIAKESLVATLLTPGINLGYGLINTIGDPVLKGAAYLIPYTLGIIPLYLALDHVVKKGTFRGVYSETIKPNIGRVIKENYLYLGLPGLLNVLLAPAPLQVPIAVGMALLFRYIVGRKNKTQVAESEKRDPTPYYKAVPRAFGKLIYEAGNKVVYRPLRALYEIGSGLASKVTEKPPAAPTLQPAPA